MIIKFNDNSLNRQVLKNNDMYLLGNRILFCGKEIHILVKVLIGKCSLDHKVGARLIYFCTKQAVENDDKNRKLSLKCKDLK